MASQPDYQTPIYRIARKGMRLNFSNDVLDPEEAALVKNLRTRLGGPLETRPGQSTLGTAGAGTGWAGVRVEDTARNDWVRYAAAGSVVNAGRDTGTGWTQIVSGLSGNPPALVPFRSALTGDPWTIIADSTAMQKVRKVGAAYEVSPLGIIPPSTMTSAISDLLTTSIAAFDGSDGTAAGSWTPTSGFELGTTNASGTPTLTDIAGLSGSAVQMGMTVGAATDAYYSFIGIAKSMDLTKLQGGAFDAFDQDYIRLLIKIDQPQFLDEIRVYLVTGTSFDATVVPGTDPATNTDAYVKSIRPHDFTDFTAVLEDAVSASEKSRRHSEVQGYLGQDGFVPQAVEPTPEVDQAMSTLLPVPQGPNTTTGQYTTPLNNPSALTTQTAPTSVPGAGTWLELGRLGSPLRRGEFMRIGNNPDATWATITGIIILGVTNTNEPVDVAFDDWFLTGGFGPDAGPTEAIPYDWRATHYDTRTGAESNGSPVQVDALRLQPQRQRCTLTAPAYAGSGASYFRQRFYRRGGLIPDDWYYIGQSTSNGGQVVDIYSDTEVQASGTINIDNDVPIQTVNLDGTVVTVSVGQVFGPLDGVVYAVGDPYRAGTAYWSKVDNPDAWPVDNQTDVSPAAEKLVNGLVWGDSAYVFSIGRLYVLRPNITSDSNAVSAQPTGCSEGLAAVRGLCTTPYGIAFVSNDGVRLTTGGPSSLLSEAIDPLFRDQAINGLNPVDLAAPNLISLAYWDSLLLLTYQEQTSGTVRTLAFDMVEKTWWLYEFATPPSAYFNEDKLGELIMIGTGAQMFVHGGLSDNGTSIAQRVLTGAWDFGLPRLDKQMGDVILDADWVDGTAVTLQTLLNNAVVSNAVEPTTPLVGRRRYHFEPFGITPQRARNIQLDFNWSTLGSTARLYFSGCSHIPEPEQSINRPTPWEDMSGGTGYLTSMLLTADTGGINRTVIVEATISNQIVQVALLTMNHNGRRAIYYSWPVMKVEQVRLRPTTDCTWWLFYDVRWVQAPEPPNIAVWDSNDEAKGDTYYTGLDMVIDTFGRDKTIEVYADGVIVTNPETGGTTFTVNANGKRHKHLTFGSGRAHIYRFIAVDGNVGRLYSWEWMLQAEPGEQNNWNQNYTIGGTLSDKWVKGVLIECDTFGVNKTVEVQVDQVAIATLTVNTTGRSVVQFSFPQSRGRVIRLWPTDHNPGRLYSAQWVFDEEPLGLMRWETQEIDHGMPSWFMPLRAFVAIRSSADVELTVVGTNQLGDVLNTSVYTIPSTAGAKIKTWVPFNASKAALVKYLVTSANPFWLYREESHVLVQPLGGDGPAVLKPFGNDDLDPSRAMGNAAARAGAPNMAGVSG